MEREKIGSNQDMLQKLKEFCEKNSLILSQYEIIDDIHNPYKWKIVVTKDVSC